MSDPRQRILVVEDEANIASFVAVYLKKAGFDVSVARNGAEALAKAGTEAPTLIILDLMLPDVDGIEVCRRIRAESGVPIIMLTPRGDTMDVVRGLESGANDYVVKPFNPKELVDRIRTRLRETPAVSAEILQNGYLENELA